MTRYASANRITIAALVLLTALALVQVGRVAPRNMALIYAVHAMDPALQSDDALARAQANLTDQLHRPHADASPKDDLIWRTLGLVHETQGKPQEALQAWSNDPASATFLLNRGLLAEHRGEADAALSWYDYATELSPQEAAPWYRLGALYEDQADMAAAETHYRRAADRAPTNRDIWFALARVLLEQEKATPALDALQQGAGASDGRIGRSAFYFQIGRIYERYLDAADLANAESAYRRAAELDDFEALPQWRHFPDYRLGEIFAARGDYLAAVDQFNRAIAIKPDFREAILSRSSALLELGETREAILALEAAIESNPDMVAAYRALADLYESLGDDAKAKELRRQAAAVGTN